MSRSEGQHTTDLFSPYHVLETARIIPFRHNDIQNKRFLDLGCGVSNPLGLSALMYANGAGKTLAVDMRRPSFPERAAAAIVDLLDACLAHPDRFHFGQNSQADFESRIRKVRAAHDDAGLASGQDILPIENFIGDFVEMQLPGASFDVSVSRAVFEHFEDVHAAARALYRVVSHGSFGVHLIDFSDHRFYKKPGFSRHSHLTSSLASMDGEPVEDRVNGLRCSEMAGCFREAGFQVRVGSVYRVPLSAEELQDLSPRYEHLEQDDLETCVATFHLIKT